MIGTVIAVGFAYGAAMNVGLRAVDGLVKNKDRIKDAIKKDIEAAKKEAEEHKEKKD